MPVEGKEYRFTVRAWPNVEAKTANLEVKGSGAPPLQEFPFTMHKKGGPPSHADIVAVIREAYDFPAAVVFSIRPLSIHLWAVK